MKPVILCILDGVGIRKEKKGNAFAMAKTPNFDFLYKSFPKSLLEASGESVGLPKGQMGNSEVGHINIGSGRTVYQPLLLITKTIEDKTFFQNEKLLKVINHVKSNNSKLQIFGLLSDGGIHSTIDHLFALLELCKKENIDKVYLHLFTDGRDTLPKSSLTFFKQLEEKMQELNIGVISTISGRYYAMDRDNRWDRVSLAYNTIVLGEGKKYHNYEELIEDNYSNNITDEFIKPGLINEEGLLEDNDGMIVSNYRPDRLRELLTAISNPEFKEFKIKKLNNIKLVTMMPVSNEVICENAFNHQVLNNTLGEYISQKGLSQLRIAETEKYAHVTYFFDGGLEKKLKNCDRILIPSPSVATYDLKPEMSASEITDTLISKIEENKYDVIIVNYANGDMLGHTGKIDETIKSIEVLDECLGRLYKKTTEKNGLLIVTADHGNCEIMLDENNNVVTAHTTSKVPFIIVDKRYEVKNGSLGDIAPTILSIIKLDIPPEMTGNVIAKSKKKTKSLIFIIISILFIMSLFITYTYRLVYYYRLENPKVSITDNTLGSKIITKENLENGLYNNGEEYFFKGEINNNYVYYSNRYYRIVKINKDKSIKLITDDIVSSLVYDYEKKDFENSTIYNWLENDYYNSLNKKDLYLTKTNTCIDKIDNNYDICKKIVTSNVGLLSIKEYKQALANKSYLNIDKYFWTSNIDSDNNAWYIFSEGGINSKASDASSYYKYGIRPTITLKNSINYIKGNGTKESPYIIEESDNLSIGSYINFNNELWKLYKIEENSYKLIKDTNLKLNNKEIEHIYSLTKSDFNRNEYNSLAYYLNTTYYNSLKNKKMLVEENWNNNEYNETNKYDYKGVNNVKSKIGIPSLGDIIDYNDFVTMTKYNETMIYYTEKDGNVTLRDINSNMTVKPTLAITKDINIKKGNGTKESPYIIE